MRISQRPFRVLLDRRGTFETPLHVTSVTAARHALTRWESAVGMRPEEARLMHGTVLNRDGQPIARIQTERNT